MLNGEEGETVKQCLGQKEIYQAIKGLELQDSKVVISNMDSQASLNNGILSMCSKCWFLFLFMENLFSFCIGGDGNEICAVS